VELKVLGICGSPIKGGNTELFLQEALKAAAEMGGVTTELIALAGKEIKGCLHCNFCVGKRQEEGKFCAQKDDMLEIYPRLMEADALLLATPVYLGRLSGPLADFLDRLRAINDGKYYHRRLENKVGGALAVAWFRNTGLETALLSIVFGFFSLKMLPVGPGRGGCQWGATGLSSDAGTGKFDPADKHGVLKDQYGLDSARNLGRRVVEVARTLKAGQEVLRTKQITAV
jgi:multimeric flavodoxin WrbA